MSLARVRALVILGALVLVMAIVVTWTILADDQGHGVAQRHECSKGAIPAATTVPRENKITLNVYNSTDQSGLAQQTADALKARGFTVSQISQDPKHSVIQTTAELRYGPKGVGAAQMLRAYFPRAQLAFQLDRTDAVVDVVLGSQFKQLNTPTEVKQAIVDLGNPSPPPGTC